MTQTTINTIGQLLSSLSGAIAGLMGALAGVLLAIENQLYESELCSHGKMGDTVETIGDVLKRIAAEQQRAHDPSTIELSTGEPAPPSKDTGEVLHPPLRPAATAMPMTFFRPASVHQSLGMERMSTMPAVSPMKAPPPPPSLKNRLNLVRTHLKR